MGRRTWIKVYCDNWLRGTLRNESAALRGIWTDVLTLAGDGAYGHKGTIQLAEGLGLTDEQISKILWITEPEWREAKSRLMETERIEVDGFNIIHIVNWSKYQSEYDRQVQYRRSYKGKLQYPVTRQSYTQKLQGEQKENRSRIDKEVEDTCMRFEEGFWKQYPKKKNKGKARAVWMDLAPDDGLYDKIIAAVKAQKKSKSWKRDNGRYIPYPENWLKNEAWEDEIEVSGEIVQYLCEACRNNGQPCEKCHGVGFLKRRVS